MSKCQEAGNSAAFGGRPDVECVETLTILIENPMFVFRFACSRTAFGMCASVWRCCSIFNNWKWIFRYNLLLRVHVAGTVTTFSMRPGDKESARSQPHVRGSRRRCLLHFSLTHKPGLQEQWKKKSTKEPNWGRIACCWSATARTFL